MRRGAALLLLVLLGVGAGLALGIASRLTGMVESRSAESLRVALDAAGLPWAEIEADGLVVTLTGMAPDAAARERAVAVAERLLGPGRISDAVALAGPVPATAPGAPRLALVILRDGGAVTLTGRVPAGDGPDAIAAALAEVPDLALTDALERVAAEPPASWTALRDGALAAAAVLRRAQIEAADCRLRITGLAPDAATRDALLARLRGGPCPVEAQILVPRPLVSPYVFSLSLDGAEGWLFACTAPGPAEIARIRAALEGIVLAGGFSCVEGLGAPSSLWTDAVVEAVAALRRLGGGALGLSDMELRLEGLPTAPEAAVLAAVQALSAALPPGFSVETTVAAPRPDAAVAPAPAAVFRAARLPGGGVRIAGTLRNQAALRAVETYAAAGFGSDAVEAALSVDPDLPEGWTARTLAALDALALLDGGRVTVGETRIALAGWTRDPSARAAAWAILGRFEGPGTAIEIEIAFQDRPEAPPPVDPALCLLRIEAILAEGQIQFPSGSVEIAAESLPLVDRIAAEMKACAGARFEIGGHTDTSGPADRNLALSRGRAEAVVDALLARGVDLDRLAARGYGETEPVADNGTEEGRALNRRIGVRLLEEGDDGQ